MKKINKKNTPTPKGKQSTAPKKSTKKAAKKTIIKKTAKKKTAAKATPKKNVKKKSVAIKPKKSVKPSLIRGKSAAAKIKKKTAAILTKTAVKKTIIKKTTPPKHVTKSKLVNSKTKTVKPIILKPIAKNTKPVVKNLKPIAKNIKPVVKNLRSIAKNLKPVAKKNHPILAPQSLPSPQLPVKPNPVKPNVELKEIKPEVSDVKVDSFEVAGVSSALLTEPVNKQFFLSVTELDSYRQKLLAMRARLRGDVSTMTDAALNKNRMDASGDLSAVPIHMADVGSDNFEQEQTLSFMQNERGILVDIEDALVRIKDGTYGICEGCSNPIPKVRLNFIPYVNMCVKCAELAQRQEEEG
ncbi:MAG: TraR/DksA C4-type zinc finger protein [Planctomycetaceae bacterium]|jgi:RNA polymerase-binding transcription factor DksA|nr:TraR/DksA C4-type zinc finger protein [Planctomycetaceae bacterium]